MQSNHIKDVVYLWTEDFCVFKLKDRLKDLPHSSHLKGRRPSWTAFTLESRFVFFENQFLLWMHSYNLIFLWMEFTCIFKCCNSIKDLPHTSHLYDRLSAWAAFLWAWRWCFSEKRLPHSLHWWGFNFKWTADMCVLKALEDLKNFSHSLHLYGRCPSCTVEICFFR